MKRTFVGFTNIAPIRWLRSHLRTRLRRLGHRFQIRRRRILARYHFGVDVAVELLVDAVVADVLERRAACGALETLDVQILAFDAHEHASAPEQKNGTNVD